MVKHLHNEIRSIKILLIDFKSILINGF